MDVSSYRGGVNEYEGDCLVFFVPENDFSILDLLREDTKKILKKIIETEGFKGEKEKLLKIPLGDKVKSVYLVGVGTKDSIDDDMLRRASAMGIRQMKKDKYSRGLFIGVDGSRERAVVEGVLLGNYEFDKYKAKKDEENKKGIEEVGLYNGDKENIKLGKIFAEAQIYARNLVNEPGNVINPVTLSEIAKKLAEDKGLKCRVYDEKDIQEMGMLALYSVGKGSSTPPRFIHIIYKPDNPKKKIVFVGKGLTFDSGGLNIKPGDYMRTMKIDKSGACAVLGIMKAVAELKPNIEVHGLIGAAENMPGGSAYRPDDIIRAKNGKTIEIDNTDAEGRVTLADVLSYASELKPDLIIDMATLTGACMVALGEFTAGLFSNDDDLARSLEEASRKTGERIWRLPLDDERLRKKIKSNVADVVNSGGRYGGAITAAMFLQEFVGEGIKWAHLDIAGPAYSKEDFFYYQKGGTGFGVRLCLEYLLSNT